MISKRKTTKKKKKKPKNKAGAFERLILICLSQVFFVVSFSLPFVVYDLYSGVVLETKT